MSIEAPSIIGIAEPTTLILDIGGSKISLVEGAETLDRIDLFKTPEDLDSAIKKIARHSAVILGDRKLDALGVAIAGEVSPDEETIVRGGPLQAYGWTDRLIRQALAEAHDIKPENVMIINDAASAGYGEREFHRRTGSLGKDYQGFIETISTGNGGAVYDAKGSVNVEPGHIDSGEEARVACGCGKKTCIEAHISGGSMAAAIGRGLENVLHDDQIWVEYKDTFNRLQLVKLEALRRKGYDRLEQWSFFGSVALLGPGIVEDFGKFLASVKPNIEVTRAHFGDRSGLYGAYFALQERLAS